MNIWEWHYVFWYILHVISFCPCACALFPHWFCDTDTPALLQAILLFCFLQKLPIHHQTGQQKQRGGSSDWWERHLLPAPNPWILIIYFSLLLFYFLLFYYYHYYIIYFSRCNNFTVVSVLFSSAQLWAYLCHLDLPPCCGSSQVSIKVCWVWLQHFPSLCQVCQQQPFSSTGGYCFRLQVEVNVLTKDPHKRRDL